MTLCEIPFKTGKITIDYEKCQDCHSYPCVKACSLFGRSLFRIQDNKPVLISTVEEAQRACIECLACELYCSGYGNKGLIIDMDMMGLDDFRSER